MKIETKITDPERIKISVTATMNLAQWQAVVNALHHDAMKNSAVMDLWHAIRTQIHGVTEYATQTSVEIETEERK